MKNMKQKGCLLLISLFALLLVVYWSFSSKEIEQKTVQVGFFEYPPYNMTDPETGELTGYCVDILDAVAKQQNLTIDYVDTRFVDYADSIPRGAPYGMGLPVIITPERQAIYHFSWPCEENNMVLVVRKGSDIQTESDLKDKTVGSVQGVEKAFCSKLLKEGVIGRHLDYHSTANLYDALLQGEIDAIINDQGISHYFVGLYPDDILITDVVFFRQYEGFPVQKEQKWLLKRINDGLRQIMNNGEYSRIYRTYFKSDAPQDAAAQSKPFPPAADADSERLPSLEIDENENSKRMLDSYFDMISTRWSDGYNKESLKLGNEIIASLKQEYAAKSERAATRLSELEHLLACQPKFAPYFASFYFRQILDLRYSFQQIRNTLEAYKLRLDRDQAQFGHSLIMVEQFHIADPELRWRKNWILKQTAPKLEALNGWLTEMDQILADNEQFTAELNQAVLETEDTIQTHYGLYYDHRFEYFGNCRSTGSAYQWLRLRRQFSDWLLTAPMTLDVILPNTVWYSDLLYGFCGCLVGALLTFFLLSKVTWLKMQTFILPYFMAWLGVFFTLEVVILPSTNDIIIFTLAGLCLSWAALETAWRIRKKALTVKGPNPFTGFVLSFAIIDILISMLLPVKVLLTVMLVLTLVQLTWLVTLFVLFKYPVMEKTMVWMIAGVAWAVAGVVAWLGYLYPSMLIAVIAGIAVSVFYTGSVFTQALVEKVGKMSGSQLLPSFVFTLMIPLLWLGLILGGIRWTGQIFNAGRILQYIYDHDLVPTPSIEISFKQILFLVLFGLFIKFVLSWLKHLIMLFSNTRKIDSGSLSSAFLVFQYIVWIFYAGYALNSLHVDWNSIKLILGGLSVGFGFALKEILENFVCGLILLIGKEVRQGDIVEFDDTLGTVQKINIRATFIKTFDNAIITLPNNQVVSKDFKNWTLNGHIRRCELNVGVAYGSDVTAVVEAIKEAIAPCDLIIKAKEPEVLFMEFGDSALIFRLRFWIHINNIAKAPSEVRHAIDTIFRQKNISIAFPQLDVHVDESKTVCRDAIAQKGERIAPSEPLA